MRSAVRAHDAQLVEQGADRLCGHFRAAIGMHDGLTGRDVLALESSGNKVFSDVGVGTTHKHPADNVAIITSSENQTPFCGPRILVISQDST